MSKHAIGECRQETETGCTPLAQEAQDKLDALVKDLYENHGIKAVYVYLRGAETTSIRELGRVRELCELFLQATATTFADLMSSEDVSIQARRMIAFTLLDMIGKHIGMPSLMYRPNGGDVLGLFDHKWAPVQ